MASTAFDTYEADGWEHRATAYAAFFGPLTGRVADALMDAAGVAAGHRVVDVGCGPGQVAAACAARGAGVVGVDIAHGMVALARNLHPDVEFRQGDAYHLPFPDGSTDAVLGNFMILHLGHPERGIAECVRVVAPGGAVALSTWDVPARCRLVGVFVDAMNAVGAHPPEHIPAGQPFFRFADEGELTRLLSGAGLGDVRVRTVEFSQRFRAADELWDGLVGGTVRMRDLVVGQTTEVQARIRAAFDRLVAAYRAADGTLTVPVSVKVAAGRVAG